MFVGCEFYTLLSNQSIKYPKSHVTKNGDKTKWFFYIGLNPKLQAPQDVGMARRTLQQRPGNCFASRRTSKKLGICFFKRIADTLCGENL